jgi:hypothetical protein
LPAIPCFMLCLGARVVVRFNHVANMIIHANHGMM